MRKRMVPVGLLVVAGLGYSPVSGAGDDGTGAIDVGPRSKTAIVFLHGWLMGPDLWQEQIAALSPDYRCYAVAQPGHGSPPLAEPVTMAHWADRLHSELAAAGIERAVIVGHSMGGMLALEMARRYPDMVLGLGLVGTTDAAWNEAQRTAAVTGPREHLANWSLEIARGYAGFLVGSSFLAAHPDWLPAWEAKVASYDRAAVADLQRAIAGRDDLTAFTPTIRVPVVVIHGRNDLGVPFVEGQALAGRIPGAALVAVSDCGHAVPLEHPSEVTGALRTLLALVFD